jgi:hypothetical protein
VAEALPVRRGARVGQGKEKPRTVAPGLHSLLFIPRRGMWTGVVPGGVNYRTKTLATALSAPVVQRLAYGLPPLFGLP